MKLKLTSILFLSLIYSSNSHSNSYITPEYTWLDNSYEKDLTHSSFFKKKVNENYISIRKGIMPNQNEIHFNESFLEGFNNYLETRPEANAKDILEKLGNFLLKNDIPALKIETDDKIFQHELTEYIDYLSGKYENSLNSNYINNIFNDSKNEITIRKLRNDLTLEDLNDKEKLLENMKGRIIEIDDLFLTEEDRINDYNFIKNSLSDTEKKVSNIKMIISDNEHLILESKNNITNNSKNILVNQQSIEKTQKQISNNQQDIKKNQEGVLSNQQSIKETQERVSNNQQGIKQTQDRVSNNEENIQQNTTEITKIKNGEIEYIHVDNTKLSSLKGHLGTLYSENTNTENSIQRLQNNFEQFKSNTQNRFYNVEKSANQGIASVAAMSNLPFTDNATFSTAIGVGNYRNATALAWGMQYRINKNIKVKASTAWNESNNFVSAGGIGINW